MILDHRTYTLHPGKLADFLAIYGAEGFPVQTEHLGQPYGWFVSHDIGELNQVVHIWKYADLLDREQRRAKLMADPRWGGYLSKAGPLLQKMENKILRAPPFFKMP
ncbi:MAG TPA: NIPSNAP family protein [Burkholderiaceae bacterium]|nr:NIPSNAP family protein [Burkholderiaceae bacterium]